MMVVVATDGKTFHAAGCPSIHEKAHIQTIAAREALRQGYAPCVRCMRQYLNASLNRSSGALETAAHAHGSGEPRFLLDAVGTTNITGIGD
jgi:methylphosphotriester-DNA--protein-cysteine methyltransferase